MEETHTLSLTRNNKGVAMSHPQKYPHTHTHTHNLTASPCPHILPHALVEPTNRGTSWLPRLRPDTNGRSPSSSIRGRGNAETTAKQRLLRTRPHALHFTHPCWRQATHTHILVRKGSQILCEMSRPVPKPRRNFRSLLVCGCLVEVKAVDSVSFLVWYQTISLCETK